MKITLLILKLLFLGALFIISNHELYLKEAADRETFFGLYYDWIRSLVNQGFDVTTYVIKFEWLPDVNQTYAKIGE